MAGGKRWVIILSGGEGERMQPMIKGWMGSDRPKQYCTFVGRRSMLEHTIDRAKQLVDPEHIVTVLGRGHRVFLKSELPGRAVEEPKKLDTLPGILLPATYVMAQDPDATVLIFPSDHFIYPEDRFLEAAEHAALLGRRLEEHLILLGAIPDRAGTDYGWIEPGPRKKEWAFSPREVPFEIRRFCEKPSKQEAATFYALGFAWSTMIVAARVQTLWSLCHRLFPEMMRHFKLLLQVLRAIEREGLSSRHEQTALEHIYRQLEPANFSRHLLECLPEQTVLFPMRGVGWSDWGRPERIEASLRRLEKMPHFVTSTAAGVL